ncbi:hypothetical protein ACLI1C_16055 [Devosia sp. XGJD_8]|uniref:hypothetical protein n=1 Tax=Devosia sp. XGJD_8 TaxID=3391187 RepID=UPI003984F177
MEVHGFTEQGFIDATIDDIRMTVPDDPANRHRQMIAEWEAEGNTIPAYVPPDAPSPFVPLKPYQFWGAVRATGHETALTTWVGAMTDPVQKGIASAMLEFSLEFRRDHPLIEAARVHLEMSEAELNDLWLWGLTL